MKRSLIALCVALGFASAQEPAPPPQDLASLLPADTLVMLEEDDLGGFRRWTKETALGRIWMEPEVQQFVKGISGAIDKALEFYAPTLGMVGLEKGDIVGIEFQRLGLALVGFSMERRQPKLDAVLTLQVRAGGEKVARVMKALRQGLANFLGVPFDSTEMRGRTVWHTDVQATDLYWCAKGDRLLVTTQKPRMEQLLLAIDTGNAQSLKTAPRYRNIMRRMGVDRSALTLYADLRAIRDVALDVMKSHMREDKLAQARKVIQTLGLDAVEAFAVADIPAGSGFRTEMAITHTAKEPRGVFKLLTHGQVNHRFARYAPADCFLYGAERWDAGPSLDAIVDLYLAFERRGAERVARFGEEFKKALGVDLRQDVIGSLGTDWAGFVGSPPEGGLIPDIAWFVSLKDRARLEKSLETMAQRAAGIAKQQRMHAELKETHFRGLRIRFVELAGRRGDPIPIAPAWAFGEDYLVFALVPQAIKNAHVERPSLAGKADFRGLMRGVPATAVSSTYLNTKAIAAWCYNTAVPILQVLQGAVNKQLKPYHMSVNLHDLPPVGVITRHLGGTMFYTAPEPGCIRMGFVSPFGSPLVTVGAFFAGATASFVGVLIQKGQREEMRRDSEARRLRAQLLSQRATYEQRMREIEKQLAELKKLIEESEGK